MNRSLVTRVLLGVAVAAGSAFAGSTGPAPTPEPATIMLMDGGVGAVLLLRHLRSKKK